MLFHNDRVELLFILKSIGVEARNLFSMTSACIHIGLVANWAKLFVPYHVICKASHSCAARVHIELFDLCAFLEKGFCPILWNLPSSLCHISYKYVLSHSLKNALSFIL